mgnify:CR=1 FL=1
MKKALKLLSILFLTCTANLFAQVHCDGIQLILEEQANSDFLVNDFSTYAAGVPRTTVARLKVIVEDKSPSLNTCSWSLVMSLDNNGAPITEWEELNLYSNGLGQNPITDILEIKITNDCATSDIDGVFVSFPDVTAINIKDIIAPILNAGDINLPGACGTKNVNGPGSYLTNYQEFTFKIEVRIKPGMSYNPGKFGLTLNFRLEENLI